MIPDWGTREYHILIALNAEFSGKCPFAEAYNDQDKVIRSRTSSVFREVYFLL